MTNLSATHRDASARRRLRLAAGAVSGAMTLVYLWMFFAVRAAEVGASENTFGAYLQLAVVYAVGTALWPSTVGGCGESAWPFRWS
jgi:hypothetical protein